MQAKRSGFLRGALVVFAWVLVALVLPHAVLRVVAHDALWMSIVLNCGTPYLYLPAFVALAIAVSGRRRLLGALSGLVVLLHLGWTFGPYTRAEPLAPDGEGFRIFSTNVMAWNGATDGIVDEIMRAAPDVVAVQELSPVWAEALARPDVVRAYPYRVEDARSDAAGSGIYSRTPLLERDILKTPSMPIARATVRLGGRLVRVYSIHAVPPSNAGWVIEWSRGLAAIAEAARLETLPVILAGDFNATQHSAWYARFRHDGFEGAHDLCGRPLATTWPNGVLPLPPIRIDHVLVSRELGCAAIREGVGAGSDHEPVVVDLAFTKGPRA